MPHISSQPEYAQIAQEINGLGTAQGKVLARLAEVESLLRTNAPDDGAAHVEAALQFAETGKVIAPTDVSTELREAHLVLRQQRDALTKVIKERQQVLGGVEGSLSRKACTEIEPAHRKLAARYLAALRELDAIAEDELAMVQSIETNGYSVQLRQYIRWHHVGLIREGSSSAIWHKVRELARYVD